MMDKTAKSLGTQTPPAIAQLGESLAGKTFLDIDAANAELCRWALRHGAGRATAIVPGELAVPVANEQPQPEIVAAEFEHWQANEPFDIVHCATLHHMFDPFHALRRMVLLARGTILLRVPAFSARNNGWSNRLIGRLLRRQPVVRLSDSAKTVNTAEETFVFTPEALRIFFNRHYTCFAPIHCFPAHPIEGTHIRVDFRKINTLTIVAGATSSGKSTLIKRLSEDAGLRNELNLPDITVQTQASAAHSLPMRELDHVVLHYDLLRPFGRAMRTYLRDPALSLLRCARHVNALTIITPRDRLIAQLRGSELIRRDVGPRHLGLLRRYEEPDFLRRWYRDWFEFCEANSVARHIVVENDGATYRFSPHEQWQHSL